ncbi:hypothetical protein P170DRAFT_453097 [Aspergillus steynii IBT 23096]|uniref:Malate dehydrogenase n=1 Tax=Aspergillus steynii IBT 23096 TaxID=1392250 RepID=A0A2I2GSL7_9EURO|nr:uncharacterized protein P170DRAFT_453097 [Aspergillus steynii IBT 23096]PLB55855.1 hypothetical protein P170DRAFT_453097 [Aspergillus steynii IBT 23096]
MLFRIFFLLSFIIFGVLAAPTPGNEPKEPEIPDELEIGVSNLDLAEEFVKITKVLGAVNVNHCPLDNIKLPLDRTNPALPNPAPGLKLKYVAIGRGTQNYTCNATDASTTPNAVGAVATLYDASCIVHRNPELLHALTGPFSHFIPGVIHFVSAIFSRLIHSSTDTVVLGEHYFEGKTPFFDMRLGGYPDWVGTKKVASADAPTKGNDVPWLKLESTNSSGIHDVYRIYTAGGKAPANCQGQNPYFVVDYAAEYWFYGN